MKKFYPNQLDTAQEMLDVFAAPGGERWFILLAQMQSGKTGCFLFLAFELVRKGLIRKFLIFCGNTEVALRAQIHQNLTDYQTAYLDHLRQTLGFNEGDIYNINHQLSHAYRILWGHQLTHSLTKEEKTQALYIYEESHTAQDKGMRPSRFLEQIGISGDGNLACLQQNQAYVLSVSATGFSELCDLLRHQHPKKVFFMRPGSGYLGIQQMLERKMIHPLPLHCSTETETVLRQAFQRLAFGCGGNYYGFIRMMEKSRYSKIILRLAQEYELAVLYYDSDLTRPQNETLSKEQFDRMFDRVLGTAPLRPTLIFLKGRLTMGSDIPQKSFIRLMIYTSLSPATDVILQQNRMTGNHSNYDIHIYISSKFLHTGELERYVRLMQTQDLHHLPHFANNLLPSPGPSPNPLALVACSPILYRGKLTELTDTSHQRQDVFCRTPLGEHQLQAEALKWVTDKLTQPPFPSIKSHQTQYQQERRRIYDLQIRSLYQSWLTPEIIPTFYAGFGVNDTEIVLYWITDSRFEDIGLYRGDVFLLTKIPCSSSSPPVPADTTGKEVFMGCTNLGGTSASLSADAMHSPEILLRELLYWIEQPGFRRIQQEITLSPPLYQDLRRPHGHIYKEILQQTGKRISVKNPRRTTDTIREISWTCSLPRKRGKKI